MCVDITNLLRLDTGILHCHCHTGCSTCSIRTWGCDMVCITGCTVSYNLAEDFRTSRLRMLILF